MNFGNWNCLPQLVRYWRFSRKKKMLVAILDPNRWISMIDNHKSLVGKGVV